MRELCLRKREVEAETTFTRMLAQFFNDDIADWSRVVMARDRFHSPGFRGFGSG